MIKRWNNIFFIVGLVSVAVMLLTFDVSGAELLSHLQRAGYWLFAIIGVWVLLYAMNAMAWKVIILGSGPCPFSTAQLMQLTISAFSLNYATPVVMLGGEPYRVMAASRKIGVQRATSSVMLYEMMHIFSHFWFWLTAVAVWIGLWMAGDLEMSVPLWIAMAFTVVFCVVAIYFFMRGYRYGMVQKLFGFLARLPLVRRWAGRFAERQSGNLAKIDEQIAALHGQNMHSFLGSFFLEYFFRILQSFEVFFMLLLFGIDGGGTPSGLFLTFLHAFLMLAFASFFANLLGFLPFQLGGREGGFAMTVAQMGLTAETGLFISIISRVREIFWIFIGLMLMRVFKYDDAGSDSR